MTRTYVVTGAASGIGKKTVSLLKEQNQKVIGVDIHDSDITVDLSKPDGRNALPGLVAEKSGGVIDALIACAGLAIPSPVTLAVNYFGTVATLEGLQPLLAKGKDPRAAVISSVASTFSFDSEIVEICLGGDEAAALKAASVPGKENLIYSTSKAALNRWLRQNAIKENWAGAGILMNMVGPGIIETPMTTAIIESKEQMKEMKKIMPTPQGRIGRPEDVANVLIFLTSPENSHMIGQMMYIDGGGEATVRGDKVW